MRITATIGVFVLLFGVGCQQDKVNTLEKKTAALEQANQKLEQRIAQLERKLASLRSMTRDIDRQNKTP
jgi:cell division protein FtsB